MLLSADGRPGPSATLGQLGGHRKTKIYGRLDCPAALRAIANGGYVTHRVFFADERTAIAAGYRPCASACPTPIRPGKPDDHLIGQSQHASPAGRTR
jgi:methylphosphotriester-DNA--protein-cysteine methyltransferase